MLKTLSDFVLRFLTIAKGPHLQTCGTAACLCTQANVVAVETCGNCALEAIPTLAEQAGVEVVFDGERIAKQYASHL